LEVVKKEAEERRRSDEREDNDGTS
jgi:hypothetical protein